MVPRKEVKLSSFGGVMEELPKDAEQVGRAAIEAVAYIMGESSAAAAALKDADSHDGPVRFWHSPKGKMWLVEKLPKGDGR